MTGAGEAKTRWGEDGGEQKRGRLRRGRAQQNFHLLLQFVHVTKVVLCSKREG